MKTAQEVARALVAVEMGRAPRPEMGDVERRLAAALGEYARDYHEQRLREALGAEALSEPLREWRAWLAEPPGHPIHASAAVAVATMRAMIVLIDHYRDLACALRHDNGYRDGWEAGLAEGVARCVKALRHGRPTYDWEWLKKAALVVEEEVPGENG